MRFEIWGLGFGFGIWVWDLGLDPDDSIAGLRGGAKGSSQFPVPSSQLRAAKPLGGWHLLCRLAAEEAGNREQKNKKNSLGGGMSRDVAGYDG